jgi:Leucine-rich repeat (LRR) protein
LPKLNQLTELPSSIKKLVNLKTLVLLDNPLTAEAAQAVKMSLPNTRVIF